MNNKDFKRHVAYEVLVILALLSLLLFVCRLWPILLLVILGIFSAAIRLLFLVNTKVPPVLPMDRPALPPGRPEPEAPGWSALQRQVTELVTATYPDARWIWKSPCGREQILSSSEAHILLNRAGGYREAVVQIQDQMVTDLRFLGVPAGSPPDATAPDSAPRENPPEPPNYEYLAFEWVEANAVALNERCNECIAKGFPSLLLEAAELPEKASWPALCQELARNGLDSCVCTEDGIQIKFKQ